jgi:hypothetical protein
MKIRFGFGEAWAAGTTTPTAPNAAKPTANSLPAAESADDFFGADRHGDSPMPRRLALAPVGSRIMAAQPPILVSRSRRSNAAHCTAGTVP